MLSHEWRELEELCERISDLRHRYEAALKTKNSGVIDALKADLTRAGRMREHLVHHISTRLGSAAAENAGATRTDGGGPGQTPDDAVSGSLA